MDTFTIGELVYQFGIAKDIFVITVINRLVCEEYTIQIEDGSALFDNHPILKNINILREVLRDGFSDKSNVKLEFDANNTVRLINVVFFGITITVDAVYLKDILQLKLPIIEKHITPKQVTDHIDYRFEHFMPEVKSIIADLEESTNKRIMNMTDKLKEHSDDIKEHSDDIKAFSEMSKLMMNVIDQQEKQSAIISELSYKISQVLLNRPKVLNKRL